MRQALLLKRPACRAIALLLLGIVSLGASGWGHVGFDDAACDPIPVHHDHSAHRFGRGALPLTPPADHCLLCHSQRSLRTGLVAVHTPIADGDQATAVRGSDIVLAGRLFAPNALSRAPPVVLL
jgi:hypothetical protein